MNYKQLFLFLFIVLNNNIYSQERINRVKLSFDTSSNKMYFATGWEYNTTLGEWINYQNVISSDKSYKEKNKILQGRYQMSRESQNFLSLETKKLTFKGVEYFVLIHEKWRGEYEYPSIYENWYEYKTTFGYIFTSEEYKKLYNIENITELKTDKVVLLGTRYEQYNESNFLDLIQNELNESAKSYSSYYTFPIYKTIKGEIRFYLPETFLSYNKYDFEKAYFETDSTNFNKIILR